MYSLTSNTDEVWNLKLAKVEAQQFHMPGITGLNPDGAGLLMKRFQIKEFSKVLLISIRWSRTDCSDHRPTKLLKTDAAAVKITDANNDSDDDDNVDDSLRQVERRHQPSFAQGAKDVRQQEGLLGQQTEGQGKQLWQQLDLSRKKSVPSSNAIESDSNYLRVMP